MSGLHIEAGLVIGGTYQITHKIGEGGMGEVWSAGHLRLPALKVAIKFLFQTELDQEGLERFEREGHIMASLSHPHITRVHDLNRLEDGTPYIVLEYLEGESLSDRIQRGGLTLTEINHILAQVSSALNMTHQNQIIHRDLKPDNIFLCVNPGSDVPLVKVLDFGVSKVRGVNKLTMTNRGFLGTPQYMSPEQALGQEDVDHRADQFSLGIILYEMLSNRLPFAADSVIAIATRVVNSDPQPIQELVPWLSEPAARALHRALSKAPGDRFESCSLFANHFISSSLQVQEADDWDLESLTEVIENQTQQHTAHQFKNLMVVDHSFESVDLTEGVPMDHAMRMIDQHAHQLGSQAPSPPQDHDHFYSNPLGALEPTSLGQDFPYSSSQEFPASLSQHFSSPEEDHYRSLSKRSDSKMSRLWLIALTIGVSLTLALWWAWQKESVPRPQNVKVEAITLANAMLLSPLKLTEFGRSLISHVTLLQGSLSSSRKRSMIKNELIDVGHTQHQQIGKVSLIFNLNVKNLKDRFIGATRNKVSIRWFDSASKAYSGALKAFGHQRDSTLHLYHTQSINSPGRWVLALLYSDKSGDYPLAYLPFKVNRPPMK